MNPPFRFATAARLAGCPKDQISNFQRAEVVLHPRQLAASVAARLCDHPDGPTEIGFGGARGGGKSHWLLAQMGADDCQRVPGLKCLLLRKVGKSNLENFEDLRRKVFRCLPHQFAASKGHLTFPNGSRIVARHFQHEKDIESHIGLEFDVIGIEEATTLTARKYSDISTCNRSSKPNWRPRIYSTTNPGGVGHNWYKARFVTPFQQRKETDTRFIPALVTDNQFINPGYAKELGKQAGWRRSAWLDGCWDIAAGQFFTTFRREIHVLNELDEGRAVEWFAAMDYGFAHLTVVLLGCLDGDGNMFIVDEHAERGWTAQRHAPAIHALLKRHRISLSSAEREAAQGYTGCHTLTGKVPSDYMPSVFPPGFVPRQLRSLTRFVAGMDVFSARTDGATVATQYATLGISLRPATMDRINGWAEILHRLGDPDAGLPPKLFIHERCARLIECLPALQHDPNRPEDVLKVDPDEEGQGGDDTADALRYLVATKPRLIYQAKLHGF
jgi:hypothetical protein